MATPKIYVKQGKKGYKEARMIAEIEKALEKKLAKNPDFTFEPATDKDELSKLYKQLVAEETEFEEIPADNNQSNTEKSGENIQAEPEKPTAEPGKVTDPFNENEPNIRDYVFKDEFAAPSDSTTAGPSGSGSFNEPVTFSEAFEIPGGKESPKQNGAKDESTSKESGPTKEKEKKAEPVNPNFNDMPKRDQTKSTKRLAKAIVYAYCTLVEKAGQWIAIKDITEQKLTEYQLNGELTAEALQLLVTLDGETQITISDFFGGLRKDAVQKIKFEQDDIDEMTELLAKVLERKGIAPSPEQELAIAVIMSTLKIGLAALSISSAAKSVLMQIKFPVEGPRQTYQAPAPDPAPTPEPQAPEPVATPPVSETTSDVLANTEAEPEYQSPIIEKSIATIE